MKKFILETIDGTIEYPTAEHGHDVEFEGVTYRLIQQPYISSNLSDYFDIDEELYYTASAVSEHGELVDIIWKAFDYWKEIDDEQAMCDWDNPVKIRVLN